MRCVLLLALLSSFAAAADEGPPPPPVLDEWIDPAETPPTTTPTTPTTTPTTPTTPTTTVTPAPEKAQPLPPLPPLPTSGPVFGALLGGLGAGVGAAAGAFLLLSPDVQSFLPDLLYIGMVLSTPALASLVAGFVVVALVVPNPGFDEFAGVAACSAIGCAATWLVLAAGLGGGAGCNPGGCGNTSNCCDEGGGGGGDDSTRGIPAAAGGGIGALAGLGLGALAIYLNDERAPSETYRLAGAIGLIAGAVVGGAIGGGIVGAASAD